MQFFDILEISPTTDIRAIKRAYAKLAAKHHPEDDEQMFLRINRAYKMAIQYAETISAYEMWRDTEDGAPVLSIAATVPQSPDVFSIPAVKEEPGEGAAAQAPSQENHESGDGEETPGDQAPAEPRTAFDFGHLQEDAQEEARVASSQSQDTDEAVDHARAAQILFGRFEEVYGVSISRNSSAAWERILHSAVFKNEMDNPLFVTWVLEFLLHHREISAHIWNGIFLPVLQEWALRYSDPSYTDIQQMLEKLIVPMKAEEWSSVSLGTVFAALLIIIAIVLSFALVWRLYGNLFFAHAKPAPTPVPSINYSDLYASTNESTLILLIKSKTGYKLVDTMSGGKITETDYEELCELYENEGEEALEQAVSAILHTGSGTTHSSEVLSSGH